MRRTLYRFLTSIPEVAAVIPPERWFEASSLDEAPSARPFAVIRIRGDYKTPTRHGQRDVEIWIHDNRGDYERIDAILMAIRSNLHHRPGAISYPEFGEELIAQADWVDHSPDLMDDQFHTNTRMASYRLTGQGA